MLSYCLFLLDKKFENKLICTLDKEITFSAFCECVL
jgi:hypothetical protein